MDTDGNPKSWRLSLSLSVFWCVCVAWAKTFEKIIYFRPETLEIATTMPSVQIPNRQLNSID
jgi:hypothetical protein